MTTVHQKYQPAGFDSRLTGLVILVAVLLMPAVKPGGAGWLTTLVPLPIFYYLVIMGQREGVRIIRTAVLVAGGAALLLGSLPLLVFSLTMVPLGFTLFEAARKRDNPVLAGLKGTVVLTATWLLFWGVFGLVYRANPYLTLLQGIDEGLAAASRMYQQSAGLAPEMLDRVEQSVHMLRRIIPRILPGLLLSGILGTVWLNLVLGNWLLKRKHHDLGPWHDFRLWRLPDNLVWGVIAGGMFLLPFKGPLMLAGLNLLLVTGVLYSFQGLAVLVTLLNRWRLPGLFRLLFYGLIFIQSYGIILLAMLGLADVWADFRRLQSPEPDPPGNGH